MISNFRYLLGLSAIYVLMLVLDFYFIWLSFPDFLLLTLILLFFNKTPYPLFLISALVFSLLLDINSDLFLGFHSLFYGLSLFSLNFIKRFWQTTSPAGKTLILIISAFYLQFLRCLLLYIIQKHIAPITWFWAIFWQIILFYPWFLLNRRLFNLAYV